MKFRPEPFELAPETIELARFLQEHSLEDKPMTQTEHLADLFKRLGRGRIDVADEIAAILVPEPKTVEIELPEPAPKKKAK